MPGHTRYPLRRGVLGNLLLLIFFLAPRSRCYVELGPERLELRVGWARVRVELSHIQGAELKPTGLRYQLGRTWKTEAARELMFAYGSGDHVLLTLKTPMRVLALPYTAISFAVEDNEALLRALAERRFGQGAPVTGL